MADLLESISRTIQNEGGYVNRSDDSGGPTKFGVTQKDLPGVNIQDITESMAVGYYLKNFVNELYYKIAFQPLADKLFDMSVLFGTGTAVRTLQIVLSVEPDGLFGPATLKAMNGAEPISLCRAFQAGLVTHAIAVATASPKDRVFLQGWITRINS